MDQDWNIITWDKRGVRQNNESKAEFLKRNAKITNTLVKNVGNKSGVSNLVTSSKKLEEESENFKHKSISLSIGKNIMRKRMEKKMTQKELALKISLPENIIRAYEKADPNTVYNPNILNKIEKVLGNVRI
jgi:ribosome-binding protein aMBF1 (putative translation factor)